MKLKTLLEDAAKSTKLKNGAKIEAKIKLSPGGTYSEAALYVNNKFYARIAYETVDILEQYHDPCVDKIIEFITKLLNGTEGSAPAASKNEVTNVIGDVVDVYIVLSKWTKDGKLDKVRAQRELLEKDLEDYADL